MSEDANAAATDTSVDELVRAAADGVDVDYLEAEKTPNGYRFQVPAATHDDLSDDEFRAVARRHGSVVAEWYFWEHRASQDPARKAFLRWIEGDDGRHGDDRRDVQARHDALRDGVSRTWGQLLVEATLADDGAGERRYTLRHVVDAETPLAELSIHDDPAAAHDVARFDADGRYRPLKTAPTLADGWAFADLDAMALVRVVDFIYPATIANWYREREGELDVTHWREAAERQTGIYDLTDELTGEQVEWLAEACCVDSRCIKRRRWDESADEPLGVPRGEGEFPCREPCSLVIAAAREFALAERDESEPVDLRLSRSELEQLERVLDAVADDEIDDVRLGDLHDGANPLRVRYLRAKLDEGRFEPRERGEK